MTDASQRDPSGRLADRTRSLERSKIRVMFGLAEEARRESDRELVRLEVGEPDFGTPDHVIDAAAEAAREGATSYTENAGIPPLREAISETMARESGVEYAPEQVTVKSGAMEALSLSMMALAGPGDEVVVPTPAWPNYVNQVQLAGATPVTVPLSAESGFDLDPERVAAEIGDETAAVILTSPSNPTGRVYDEDAVAEVVEVAAAHDAYVVADEVYGRLTYDRDFRGVASYVDTPENVITVDSCSKTYAMTGWRLGWLAGPQSVVDAVTSIGESTTACPSSVSQQAALAALTGPQEPVDEMKAAFEERRDFVVERVAEMPTVSCPRPEGAFYAFLDVSDLPGGSFEVAKRLLSERGVVTAPGDGFGDAGEGYLRISFANGLDRIEEGLDRIERFVRDES
ncbi:pyridoxal phosphate-dependent aminotransferase [Halorussus gelatinilyticus]|uniref:Aminotransferase n=1 Tax=Halorussus gelatinilyticus TaxID=2937524 RepID=A0A8U0IIE6_9EURY|nr:pyridoxal phosphate-dependent aminotransferase [Halorussus gelatinilyticus]UPV99858.1 pyridoxal phosphate-dependent aminotransferase [Halorussus gelatinilyticus]